MNTTNPISRCVFLFAVASTALAATALVGCNSGDDPAAPSKARWLVGYSQCNRGEPWREQMDKSIRTHADAHAELRVVMKDAQNEALQQIAHVREFIAQGVDALIISPKDTSLTEAVAAAHEKGIPVIVLDRAVDGDRFTCFIGADNRKIGAEVAKWVIGKLDGKGKVVELKGLTSSPPGIDRSEPFHTALESTDIEIVYEADMEWLGDKAREKMLAALTRNPEKDSIQLVYGANDPAAIQAYYAAKDKGRDKEMIFVGVDALPHEGIEAVRAGILAATFEYPNGADIAIATLLKILSGERVAKKITLGTRLFTPDNLEKGGKKIE